MEGATMKVKLNKNYKYYIPFIFAGLLFVIVIYFLNITSQTLQTPEKVLSSIENGDKLITDKQQAKNAANSPLILGDETSAVKNDYQGNPALKTVVIIDPGLDLVEIVDSNTLISFKNSSGSKIILIGALNSWRAEIEVEGVYSQMFEKPGKYEFAINDKPVGVVRVR
jgi:hypothetical protein